MSAYDGSRLRDLRLKAGLRIEALATAAGISPNTVRAVEKGRHQPRPRVVQALARTLGVPLRELAKNGRKATLREVRGLLGLTQAEMAARVGASRQRVSQVERGVGTVRAPHLWAAAYGLTPDQWARALDETRDLVRQKVRTQIRQRRTTRGDTA
ncbi:helix-turn-helix transcriptional regulator [Streptomyces collinus]|uniref:helix-turn-helix transcriptional regulator n=1 Tax=Streptomyces collinus TaxID=42684 RepID=UPI0034086F4C